MNAAAGADGEALCEFGKASGWQEVDNELLNATMCL